MSTYGAIRARLDADEIVMLDGAIGTEILRRDLSWADHQVLAYPDKIRGIHEDYIRAGADVLTTNTFQLARWSFENHFRDRVHLRHIGAPDLETRADALLTAAVRLAREARDRVATGREVAIAGAVTTLEWCFRPDLAPSQEVMRAEYREIMDTMARAGADLILLETVNSVAEARVGLEAAHEVGLPCWVSFVCDERGRLFTGETMADAARALTPLDPEAILLNCAPPSDVTVGLRELARAYDGPKGAYAHIGRFDPPEWMFTDEFPPDLYLAEARRWVELGARILGGCCGTTPDHIAALVGGLRRANASTRSGGTPTRC
ncbi:MAG: homocysteine S-methyltransferase family protein [Acidobacteria bacterium]|nr:homocysteine S-methyltransferase family protein [Acidobacteriota bacterium]